MLYLALLVADKSSVEQWQLISGCADCDDPYFLTECPKVMYMFLSHSLT